MEHPLPQAPAWQSWPLPHEEPSFLDVHAVVEVAGWQLRQPLLGSVAAGARTNPSMKHPAAQVRDEQTEPDAHAVPSGRALKTDVDVAGWQLSQAFDGLVAPLAAKAPPT